MSSNPWAKYYVKGGSRNFQANYCAKVSSTFSDVLNSHIRLPGSSSAIYLHPHLQDLFKYQHLLLIITNLKKLNTNPECIQIYWEHLWHLVLRLLVKEAADSEDCWPSQPSILSAFWHSLIFLFSYFLVSWAYCCDLLSLSTPCAQIPTVYIEGLKNFTFPCASILT